MGGQAVRTELCTVGHPRRSCTVFKELLYTCLVFLVQTPAEVGSRFLLGYGQLGPQLLFICMGTDSLHTVSPSLSAC